ncbi:MAG: hypothetical protein ACOYOK_13670 [Pseudobdellovibrionaceae bacterium]
MAHTQIEAEIQKFQNWPRLLNSHFCIEPIDEFGFVFRKSKDHFGQPIQLLVTALIHGDEVIGIESINHLLANAINHKVSDYDDFGFLLCNVEAAIKHCRFIEFDLNRSFSTINNNSYEHQRSCKISKIIKNTKFNLDLHQTIEPSIKPFFVSAKDPFTIQIANRLSADFPILLLAEKSFSSSGKTLLEYVVHENKKGLVIEYGQKGFSQEKASALSKIIMQLNVILKNLEDPNLLLSKSILTYQIVAIISGSENSHLLPGFMSGVQISKNQILGYDAGKELLSPSDGLLFFPKYENFAPGSSELCYIAEQRLFSMDVKCDDL